MTDGPPSVVQMSDAVRTCPHRPKGLACSVCLLGSRSPGDPALILAGRPGSGDVDIGIHIDCEVTGHTGPVTDREAARYAADDGFPAKETPKERTGHRYGPVATWTYKGPVKAPCPIGWIVQAHRDWTGLAVMGKSGRSRPCTHDVRQCGVGITPPHPTSTAWPASGPVTGAVC